MTIFDLLLLFGIAGSTAVGIALGGDRFGIGGGILGGMVGLTLGWIVGRLPWLVAWAWMRRDLRRASSDDLRARVREDYFMAHLLIAELASRGESIDDLRPIIAEQLNSDSEDERRFAQNTARVWFPDLIEPAEG